MKYAAKIDANQPTIVKALRAIGAQVVILSAVGGGVPDLMVSFKRTFLIEVKDGAKPPSARKLTPDQVVFHAWWGGEIYVVETVEQALEVTLGEKSCSE